MAALVTAFPMHYGGRVVGRRTAFMSHPMSYIVWPYTVFEKATPMIILHNS